MDQVAQDSQISTEVIMSWVKPLTGRNRYIYDHDKEKYIVRS